VGLDKIKYEPKCGFDDVQLEKLFPEEMRAYKRWRRMHKAYTDSKNDDESKIQKPKAGEDDDENGVDDGVDEDDDEDNDEDDDDDKEQQEKEEVQKDQKKKKSQGANEESQSISGGHLNDRLAQFDARTERMKEEWYMTFAIVRQGSFLSKSYSAEDRLWEKTRKKKIVGKKPSTWQSLHASYVQFLHWVGFDHRSALPPPNEETTEALAFLGYDFMGKIIEKAIFLRCLEKREKSRRAGGDKKGAQDSEKLILELEYGEQLTDEDIERAVNDSTVAAKPLYCATNSVIGKGPAIQLYFGPGFEDRIEMELEQMVMGKEKETQLSEEEKKIRVQEDELFEKICTPLEKVNGILDILGQQQSDTIDMEHSSEKKRPREKDEEQPDALKKVAVSTDSAEENVAIPP